MLELVKDIEKLNHQSQNKALKSISEVSASLLFKLIELSKEHKIKLIDDEGNLRYELRNLIRPTQITKLMKELEEVENEIESMLTKQMISSLATVVIFVNKFLLSKYDVKKTFDKDIERTFVKSIKVGDKTLEQRIKVQASETVSDLRKYIRSGILSGTDSEDIYVKVRNVFKDTNWKVQRLIESEVYTTYRYTFGQTALMNGYDWIQLHEAFPRHPRRKTHECYKLINEDRYGKGKGVFKSTDCEIYFPHPKCTSWIEVVEVLD